MSALSERMDWSPEITYVIGHQRPDTDAIASALGYAWLLSQDTTEKFQAARAGQPSEQARYALRRYEQDVPVLLSEASPTFGHILERTPTVAADAPLTEALAQLAAGQSAVPITLPNGRPCGLVSPLALARALAVGNLESRTCGTLAEVVPVVRQRDRLSDHKGTLLRAEASRFIVQDDQGRYVGLAAQKALLHPPRARLILVDHNELGQAVPGADEAEIVGVLDHHRLGNPPTPAPIPFMVDPVGSTSTLVAEQCRARRITPPRALAGMLLSGILSDTLVFRSPTSTPRDEAMASWLGGVARVDVALYGEELLSAAPGLSSRTAEDIVDSDRKTYVMAQQLVSIGQVEVSSLRELPERQEELLDAMTIRRVREGHALVCLMVTDVIDGVSRLLVVGERTMVDVLPFSRVNATEFDLGHVVSRKKQLVPTLQASIEQ
ncbi:DHHA2 domain-containing protein [Armatimonas sp.]|uniref:DHHA2 domain-containing protein n=1 Tax=Armatimonas sp. TaxID=1872638 RepID=UPI00375106C1